MAGWGRVVAGAVLGVVGTVYATNEDFRKQLPKAARNLPVTVRRRFEEAVAAAREASSSRRAEILADLEEHGGGNHAARGVEPIPDEEQVEKEADPRVAEAPEEVAAEPSPEPEPEPEPEPDEQDIDATRPLPRMDWDK